MEPEKRVALFKELELVKQRLGKDPAFRYGKVFAYGFGILCTIGGCMSLVDAIERIARDGSSYLSVVLILAAFVLLTNQWYFIARYQFNNKLRLILEALLANNENHGTAS